MRSLQNFIGCTLIATLISLVAFAQSSETTMSHFVQDGVAFDYPIGWTVTDKSTQQAQRLIVTRNGSSVQIMILMQRDLTLRTQLPGAQQNVTEPLVKEVAQMFGVAERFLVRTATHIDVAGMEADGIRLRAPSDKKPSTGEVFSFRKGVRFTNMVFFRADADESQATPAWTTIRSTLKVDAPVVAVVGVQESSEKPKDAIEGGVLNGKALELPRPAYPPIARAAHVSGIVAVQVLIDEKGNVVAAHAVSGHPLLLAVCVDAARQAKFSPTLLEDQPVKVTGVITYNFVAQ